MKPSFILTPECLLGTLQTEDTPAPIADATVYLARDIGDGLGYIFPKGALADMCYLTADTLLDGEQLAVFALHLQEGQSGPTFVLSYGLLSQCTARLRVPLEAVNQNRWRYEREGAWLKPICGGQRVDLRKVDRMRLVVLRKGPQPVRFSLTPITATVAEPPRLETLTLPKGKLLDEMGQSTLHEWPTKSRSPEEVTERLHTQLAAAPEYRLPPGFSRRVWPS
mgnify:FL=1